MDTTKLERVNEVVAGTRPVSEGCRVGADQEIIDAVVSEGNALLRELFRRGLSSEAVRARADQIGLTREFVKQSRLSGSRPAMRVCVNCDVLFLSAGKHNRLCRRCVRS